VGECGLHKNASYLPKNVQASLAEFHVCSVLAFRGGMFLCFSLFGLVLLCFVLCCFVLWQGLPM
jgi:hypothetical protein